MNEGRCADAESVQGDQVVALGEMNRNRMAMGSALRVREAKVKQALTVVDEDGMHQTDGNEVGTGAPDTEDSNENSFQDAMDEG